MAPILRHHRAAATGVALILSCVPALADYACTFVTECMGTDGCDATDYDVTIEEGEITAASVRTDQRTIAVPVTDTRLTDISGSVDVSLLTASPDGVAWFGAATGSINMLSLGDDGTAFYSVHMHGSELSLQYTGSCEAD